MFLNRGTDWLWAKVSIQVRGSRHLVATNERLSPALIVNTKTAHLSVPFKSPWTWHDLAAFPTLLQGTTRLSVNLDSPDCCFIEDTAIMVDEAIIITNIGSPSRQHESKNVAPELARYRETIYIEPPAMIDGGDVLRLGRRLYVGVSGRTHIRGFHELARILRQWKYEVIPVELKNCLHLKTACTAINEEVVLLNPQWVAPEVFSDYNVLSVPKDESWAANIIWIGNRIFLQHGFPQTLELFEKYHDSIATLDISEFRKVEAGLSCLSIILQDAA